MFTADFPKSSWDVAARYGRALNHVVQLVKPPYLNHVSRLSPPLLLTSEMV